MKRFLFCLAIPVVFIFTGSADTSDISIHLSKRTLDAVAAGAPGNMPAGGCGSLIYFQKGAIVKGVTYDSAGKENGTQTSTILDAKDAGGETISNIKMDMSSSYGTRTMNVEYKCDGSNLYVDLNTMASNFRALKGAKVEAGSLKFPIHLSVGQTLPDASVTVTMDRGKMKMKTVVSHVDRKVEATEKITTPGGTWNCYRVVSKIKTTTDYGDPELQKRMESLATKIPPGKMIAWFAPDFGIVKMEMYNYNKLVTRSLITSVKQ